MAGQGERRLAAILAADVAGYSRLMGTDEEGTHERLRTLFREFIEPKIAEHRGRIVKNTGDGLLADFASVVDAARCAAEVQRGMIDRELEVPEEQRLRFRIGINLADVIVEEHDIFGDGVNIAARLEGLAEPGGICLSRVARDEVRNKLDFAFAFEDMGEQPLKNIDQPVRVYALRREVIADLPAPSLPPVLTGRTTFSLPKEFSLQILGTTIRPYTANATFLQSGAPTSKTVPGGKTIGIVPYIFELDDDKTHKTIWLTDDFPLTFANRVRVTFVLFKDAKGQTVFFSVYNHSSHECKELQWDQSIDPHDTKIYLGNDKEGKWMVGLSLPFFGLIFLLYLVNAQNLALIASLGAGVILGAFRARDWLRKKRLRQSMERLRRRIFP